MLKIKILIVILLVILQSCETTNKDKKIITDSYLTNNYELIGSPVELHYVTRNGMKYMIASGKSSDSGTAICNLTLDSLQVEYYKKQLK